MHLIGYLLEKLTPSLESFETCIYFFVNNLKEKEFKTLFVI